MIDLDQMEAQLAAALTDGPAAAPAPAPRSARRQRPAITHPLPPPAPVPAVLTGGVPELLALGLLDAVDARIDETTDRSDYVTWTTMRAILAGRQEVARAGIRDLIAVAQAARDAEALERTWAQRFWVTFEWGSEAERFDVLDHCRERAYRFDDVCWSGNLALLLAAMGKTDEAIRAFDAALKLVADDAAVDAVTNLVEAAAMLGDAGRVAAAGNHLRTPVGQLVVVGAGEVCKGSVDRYRGIFHAALGQWPRAGDCFRSAEAVHRAIGAGPLLTRTLQQASGGLVAA